MATPKSHARKASRSSIVALSEFASNASTLEKSLRLAHALSWSLIAFTRPHPDPGLLTARAHLAVSRRFFRLLKWVDSWSAATVSFNELRTAPSVFCALAFAKHALLTLYFFTEMLALPYALGLSGSLAANGLRLQFEADRFWLYALLVSFLLGILELAKLQLAPVSASTEEVPLKPVGPPAKRGRGRPRKSAGVVENMQLAGTDAESSSVSSPIKGEPVKRSRDRPRKDATQATTMDDVTNEAPQQAIAAAKPEHLELFKGVVVDACDTLIPAWCIGLAPLGEVGVGVGMTISTIIPLWDMWSAMQLEKST